MGDSSLARLTSLTAFLLLALVIATPTANYVYDSFRYVWNTLAGTQLCVSVGEPLYPATTVVPLGEFRADWGHSPWNYQISVNELTMEARVQSPDGNVGAWHVAPRGLLLSLVAC